MAKTRLWPIAFTHCNPGRLAAWGHAFWHHYSSHGFAFPGEPDALNASFAVPHDTTHLLSGYDTTYRGEILVSTFTAGMHPDQPMAGHILPVIFSWHLGVELVPAAGAHRGALDVERFWEAWARGSHVRTDVFDTAWDFWALIDQPLADLRDAYAIPPLQDATRPQRGLSSLTTAGGPPNHSASN